MTVQARFEVEYGLRVGPRRDDYRVLQAAEVIEVTDDLRAFNTASGVSVFDYTPREQAREFGRVIVKTGHFPETDHRAAHWYRPLSTEPEHASVTTEVQSTSTTLQTFSNQHDRTDRYEP